MAHGSSGKASSLRPVDINAAICHFLGAGFSAATAYRLPTSVGFLTREDPIALEPIAGRAREATVSFARFEHTDFAELFTLLETDYGPLDSLNIETVLTDLYVRAFGIGRAWSDEQFGLAPRERSVQVLMRTYESLLRYIVTRIRLRCGGGERCALTERFVRLLRQKDSIVTLNYDYIIEKHLRENDGRLHRLRYTLGPPFYTRAGDTQLFRSEDDDRRSILVKLHGSVDWVTCPNEHCPNRSFIQPTSSWYRRLRAPEPYPRCMGCGYAPRPVIIPPISVKSFDLFPKLSLLWRTAYNALRRAQRWTFIGVSFATNDFHLRALLRDASRDATYMNDDLMPGQICIVDRSEEAARGCATRLMESLTPEVREWFESTSDALVLFPSVSSYLEAAERMDGNVPHPEAS